MREYVFQFEQDVAIRLGLKLNELLLLDYLLNFMASGEMKSIFVDGEKYYWVSYKKIMDDLPILGIGLKQLKKIIHGIEEKGVIRKLGKLYGKLYICVDTELISGTKVPIAYKNGEQKGQLDGTKVPPIDNYNNKIKINIKTRGIKNEEIFLSKFLMCLKELVGEIIFNCNIKDKIMLCEVAKDYIVYEVISKNPELFKRLYLEKIHKATLLSLGKRLRKK